MRVWQVVLAVAVLRLLHRSVLHSHLVSRSPLALPRLVLILPQCEHGIRHDLLEEFR
jgi:hypothetical protein